MTSDVDQFTSRTVRLGAEIDAGGQELEWWRAHLEDVTTGIGSGEELRRVAVATARFARVHGLVWGRSIIEFLDAETQELYEIGERLFEGHDEDTFEDFREFRSTLIVIDTVTAQNVDDAADLVQAVGRIMDDSMVVLAPDFSPWVEPGGRPVDDQLRLHAAARAWARVGLRPSASGRLLILNHAETLIPKG